MAEQDSPPPPTEGSTEAQVKMLALYLKCTTECMEGVQKLPSPKFYNRQCEYLNEKLQKFVPIAGDVLDRPGSSVDAERHIDILKLALVLGKKIESFVKSCGDDSFIQAAMALINMSKCVASIGFDLELCKIALRTDDGCTGRLTLNQVQAKYEDEVKEVEAKVSEDVEILFNTVLHQLSEESWKNEKGLMAIHLLQRLKRVHPTAPSIPSGSPSYSVIDDPGLLGAMYKFVRPGRKIGKGASATVYEATWLGTQVAKKTFVGRENSDFMMEAKTLARFNHPNITSMFCCEKDRWSSSIIMEIMDGDLHTLMLERCRRAGCDNPPFTIFEAVDIMLQIGEGVNYLHGEGICHRDLKSLNILVKSMLTSQSEVEVGYVHAKVTDFGLSKTKNSTTLRDLTLNTGSSRWMAPEIMGGSSQGNSSSEPRHPLKIDVHSFAMLCYEILRGFVPFDEENEKTVRIKIKSGIRPELSSKYCPPELKALIQECWEKIPRKRPSFPVICSKLKYVKYLLMTGFCSSEDTEASTSVESETAKPKIFVSYSVSDLSFGEQLSTDLRSAMNHFVMFDQEVTKGENYGTIIRDATKECKVAVFVLSKEFFASKWQMLELVAFVRAVEGSNSSLRLIPLFYKVSQRQVLRMEVWRPRWDEFAQHDSLVDPEEWDMCVRSLASFYCPDFVVFGGSEMRYRAAIVESIASYDRECEELASTPMLPSCEQYSEEISCSVRERGYQIVLIYSGYQLAFVEQLDKELAVRNLSVFFVKRSLYFGEPFDSVTEGAILGCQIVVVILSHEYLCRQRSMIGLQQAVGRCRQINNPIRIIPLFYKLSIDDLNDESIQQRWRPQWEEISRDDPVVDPERFANAVRVLRAMKGLSLKDFNNSEVKFRHAIVEEIVKFLDTRASVKL